MAQPRVFEIIAKGWSFNVENWNGKKFLPDDVLSNHPQCDISEPKSAMIHAPLGLISKHINQGMIRLCLRRDRVTS
ncbi:hypothetical protein QQP08_007423 [Theobroma cacao]|nr:hypothetical protein QQP08_007423 [Theobroma cacao]